MYIYIMPLFYVHSSLHQAKLVSAFLQCFLVPLSLQVNDIYNYLDMYFDFCETKISPLPYMLYPTPFSKIKPTRLWHYSNSYHDLVLAQLSFRPRVMASKLCEPWRFLNLSHLGNNQTSSACKRRDVLCLVQRRCSQTCIHFSDCISWYIGDNS